MCVRFLLLFVSRSRAPVSRYRALSLSQYIAFGESGKKRAFCCARERSLESGSDNSKKCILEVMCLHKVGFLKKTEMFFLTFCANFDNNSGKFLV